METGRVSITISPFENLHRFLSSVLLSLYSLYCFSFCIDVHFHFYAC